MDRNAQKAFAYNVASQVIQAYCVDAELEMRKACQLGKSSYIEVRGFFTNLFYSLMAGYIPVACIVFPISYFSGLKFLESLLFLIPIGMILFLPLWYSFSCSNSASRWRRDVTEQFIGVMQSLAETEKEEMFLFLRHQGIISQKMNNLYSSGYNDGFGDGMIMK